MLRVVNEAALVCIMLDKKFVTVKLIHVHSVNFLNSKLD